MEQETVSIQIGVNGQTVAKVAIMEFIIVTVRFSTMHGMVALSVK